METVPLVAVPVHTRAWMSRRAAMVASLATVVLIAAIYSSQSTGEISLSSSSAMLEPYFAWQAEQNALSQNSAESDLSPINYASNSDSEQLASLDAAIRPLSPHASVTTEMAAEFKDRDLLAAVKRNLRAKRGPQSKLASDETQDDAETTKLLVQISALQKKKAHLHQLLKEAEERADPRLRRASGLYEKAHSLEDEYNGALNAAKDDMKTGKGDLAKSALMKHEFFAEEKPVDQAQQLDDDANFKYRRTAMAFADEMLKAEKMGKNTKLRAAAEKKLNALRAQLSLDSAKRESAQKQLENAQAGMRIKAGLQDYDRWKLRGQQLIAQGKDVMGQAELIKHRLDEWKAPLDRAQKAAAKAETRVHGIRERENKVVSEITAKTALRSKTLAARAKAAAHLKALESEEVSLRQKGMALMTQYHQLKKDVANREAERAKKTAAEAEKNASALKSLVKTDE